LHLSFLAAVAAGIVFRRTGCRFEKENAFEGITVRVLNPFQSKHALERFRTKWVPVCVKKTRQTENLESSVPILSERKGL
jgi:hypothetical protein